MRTDLARKLFEEQDTIFRQYDYETKLGAGDGGGREANTSEQEHVGRNIYMVIGKGRDEVKS